MKINVSRMKTFLACPQQARFAYMSRLLGGPGGFQAGTRVNTSAEFGTAVHLALELIAKGEDVGEAIAAGQRHLIEKAREAEAAGQVEAATRLRYGPGGGRSECRGCGGTGKTAVRQTPHKTCGGLGYYERKSNEGTEYLDVMVRAYLEEYPVRHGSEEQSVFIERELEMSLGGHTIVGRLDRAVVWNDGLYHRNYKTLYQSGSFAIEAARYEKDWHEAVYWLLLEANRDALGPYKDVPIRGSFIDILRKTQQPTFQRISVWRRPELEEKIRYDVSKTLDRWLQTDFSDDLWSGKVYIPSILMNPQSCVAFNRVCQFNDICNGEIPLEPEALRLSGYEARGEDYTDVVEGD